MPSLFRTGTLETKSAAKSSLLKLRAVTLSIFQGGGSTERRAMESVAGVTTDAIGMSLPASISRWCQERLDGRDYRPNKPGQREQEGIVPPTGHAHQSKHIRETGRQGIEFGEGHASICGCCSQPAPETLDVYRGNGQREAQFHYESKSRADRDVHLLTRH